MDPVIGLSLGRIAIGAAALASPEAAGKLFRLDTAGNRQLPYMMRMFGSREVALGVVTLASRGRARKALVAVGVAIDGSDAWAGQEAGRSGAVDRRTSQFLVAPAAGAVVAGLLSLVRRNR